MESAALKFGNSRPRYLLAAPGRFFTRRIVSSVAVGALLVGGLGAASTSPAHATPTFTNTTSISSGLGDNMTYGVYAVGSTIYAATEGGLSISTNGGTTFTNYTTADGLGNNIVYGVYAVGSTIYAATHGGLSISIGVGSQGEELLPAPIIQQFGKVTSGSCDAAAPESLNWSSVASGRWSESWAQWVNNGAGGAVCTRTLVYSSSQSHWVVA